MHSLRPNLAVPKLGEPGGLSCRRCSRDLCAARDRLADGGLSEADVAGEGGLGEEAEADAGGCHFLRWRVGVLVSWVEFRCYAIEGARACEGGNWWVVLVLGGLDVLGGEEMAIELRE